MSAKIVLLFAKLRDFNEKREDIALKWSIYWPLCFEVGDFNENWEGIAARFYVLNDGMKKFCYFGDLNDKREGIAASFDFESFEEFKKLDFAMYFVFCEVLIELI